jgi:hypothetical protein
VTAASQSAALRARGSIPWRRPRVPRGLRDCIGILVFGLIPLALPIFLIVYLVHHGSYGHDGNFYDLHTMWLAGRDVAHGRSPYPFVYPAPAAVMMVPIGVLPWRAAVVVFFILSTAAVFATLRILGVRDWRCYGACLVALPAASAIWIGTLSPLLALAAACAWRWRDRRAVPVLALTAVVVTKLFLWPLFIWLLATRRLRTAIFGVATIVGVTAVAWALIGFRGLLSYPKNLAGVASIEQYKGYSTVAVLHAFGLTGVGLVAAAALIGALALSAVIVLARRRGGDVASFAASIGAALLISPIVWVHYLVLLFVPIAVVRQRLSGLWLLPLVLWPLAGQESGGSIPRLVLVLLVVVFWLASIARARPGASNGAPLERRPALAAGTGEDPDRRARGDELVASIST